MEQSMKSWELRIEVFYDKRNVGFVTAQKRISFIHFKISLQFLFANFDLFNSLKSVMTPTWKLSCL